MVAIPWSTANALGASVTRAANGSFRIYKGSSLTERTSSNGVTDIEDFDGVTGCHMLTIDTADNSDPGFYATGNIYSVMMTAGTIDGQTVNDWIGQFVLGQMVGVDSVALSSSGVVQIVNVALIALGEPTITSLEDDSKAARLANTLFTFVRDAVLEDNNWKAAKARASLAKLATTPVWGFTAEFQLPSDFLRLVALEDPTLRYEIHGRKMLTDASTVNIEYIRRIDDPNEMDVSLRDAIASRLAFELSLPLTQSTEKQRLMWDIYQAKLRAARYLNAAQRQIEAQSTPRWTGAHDIGGVSDAQYSKIKVIS